jgi:hypothetical protein
MGKQNNSLYAKKNQFIENLKSKWVGKKYFFIGQNFILQQT